MDSLVFAGEVVDMNFSQSRVDTANDRYVIQVAEDYRAKLGKDTVLLAIKEIKNFQKIWQGKPVASLIGKTIFFENGTMRIVGKIKKKDKIPVSGKS